MTMAESTGFRAVLVIGAHREELAFGDRVAESLRDTPVEILRIPNGISGRRPRQDETFRYGIEHRELYLQLRQQLRGRADLFIDLHAGQDADGGRADLYCQDQAFLECMRRRAPMRGSATRDGNDDAVRCLPLRSAEDAGTEAVCEAQGVLGTRTAVPRAVWGAHSPLYLALEIYLRSPGDQDAGGTALARDLVELALTCARRRSRKG
jgi:hypothetical protein